MESLGMSKVGEPTIASFSAGSERLWWTRTRFTDVKKVNLLTEKKGEIHNWEFQ